MIPKENRIYKCGFCGYEFRQDVGTYAKVSSQVKCKRCNNFMPTWKQ
jgi:DNA-directed RNA polymerase subunit RPC12/RpoP